MANNGRAQLVVDDLKRQIGDASADPVQLLKMQALLDAAPAHLGASMESYRDTGPYNDRYQDTSYDDHYKDTPTYNDKAR